MARQQSFESNSPEQRRSKLRDSCTACARSKVRCCKEKPTCQRCRRKGWACEYAASNRTGRSAASTNSSKSKNKNDAERNNNTHATSQRPTNAFSPGTSSSFPDIANWTPPSQGQDMSLDTDFNFDAMFPNLMSSNVSQGQQRLATPGTFSSTPESNGIADTAPLMTFPTSQPAPASFDFMDLSQCAWPESGDPFMESFGFPDFTESSSSSSQSPIEHSQPHCCLTAALDTLSRLFPKSRSACSSPTSRGPVYNPPTLASIISQNKQITQTVSEVLECSCSQDAYLLSAAALIMLKLLAGYAAAARDTVNVNGTLSPGYNDRQGLGRVSSGSSLSDQISQSKDGTEDPRMALHLVLSELHRVQRLLKRFERRVEEVRRKQANTPKPNSHGVCKKPDALTSAFSELTLNQLESQLRSRFRAVSSTTRELLRQR